MTMPVPVIGGRADPGAFEMAPRPAADEAGSLSWDPILSRRHGDCTWRERHRARWLLSQHWGQQQSDRNEGPSQYLAHKRILLRSRYRLRDNMAVNNRGGGPNIKHGSPPGGSEPEGMAVQQSQNCNDDSNQGCPVWSN